MTGGLILLPEADHDISEAYRWHERRRVGLGKDLLEEFESALKRIKLTLEGFSVAFDNFRHLKVGRFPYVIYYESERETIVIYAVFQASQDPGRLRAMLDLRKPEE